MTKLQFSKSIVSTVGSPIATRELLSRLQALLDELSAVDQDDIDKSSLTSVKTQLVNKKLIRSSNAGVQLYVCVSIADLLRVYAPDAPFTASELSSIFKAMFQQLKKLSDVDNAYFQQQSYLLKRLAEVRSIILITDLPDADALIEQVFDILYDVAASKNFPSKLEPMASGILAEIILEADTVSTKVVKKILNNLSASGDSGALFSLAAGSISNPGSKISVAICEANIDKMSRQVAKLFSEMLYDSTSGQQDQSTSNSQLFENLRKIHRLSITVWKYVPEMLNSLIGLIDDELKADDEKIRSMATETIGYMISNGSGGTVVNKVSFVSSHKDIWLGWLKKTLDSSPLVRCKWVEQFSRIIDSESSPLDPEIVSELNRGIMKSLVDSDERVRYTACKALDKLTNKSFMEKVCNEKILTTLFQLLREKNLDIRNQVLKLLAKVHHEYLTSKISEQNDEVNDFDSLINEIPSQILSLVYINDKQINATVDISLFEDLLPLETNDVKRVERLCMLFSKLDLKSKSSFLAICKRQRQVSSVLEKYLELSDSVLKAQKGDDVDEKENITSLIEKLDKTISWMEASLPEGLNSRSCLERFYKLSNFRFFYLLRISISPESEYISVKNSMKELLSKLNNPKNLKLEDDKTNVSTTDMVSNIKLLMYRSSLILLNQSNVNELINFSSNKDHQWNQVATDLLENMANIVPEVFKSHINGLSSIIIKKEEATDIGRSLKTFYKFIGLFPELFPNSPEFIEVLKSFTINGTPTEAKYAIKIISYSKRKEIYCSSIFNSIYPLHIEGNEEKFATHLSLIAGLFLCDPLSVEEAASDITTLLIKEVLLKNRKAINNSDSWISDYDTEPALNEKVLSLRIFVNRLKVCTPETVSSVAQPVLKLLVSLIGNGGEIVNDESTPDNYKSQLRLLAGYYILKLAKVPMFNDMLTQSIINRIVYLLHDLEEEVRSSMLQKLQKHLVTESISEKFLPLLFFMGHEPSDALKASAETGIKSMFNRQQQGKIRFESVLPRLIHMVSHQQDFTTLIAKQAELEEILKAYTYAQEYIVFFLRNIAKSENVSLLYYLASRVKQYRDATIEDTSLYNLVPLPQTVTNLYSVAELVQLMIKELCELRGWSMQTWPGKIKLALDLFSPMKSTEEAQTIVTKTYIPDNLVGKLKTIFKYKLNASKSSAARSKAKISSERKLAAAPVKRAKTSQPKASKVKKVKVSAEPSRKSTRVKKSVQYVEEDSDENGEGDDSEGGSQEEESDEDSDY